MSRHIQAQPTDPSLRVKSRSTFEVVRRVGAYLRPYPGMAIGVITCALLSQAAAMSYPKLTRLVIDQVIGQRRADLLTPVVLALLGAFILRDAFNSLRIRLNNIFEQRVILDIRRQLYGHLQRLPQSWFDHRATGDLMTRVLEDVGAMERLLIDGTEQGVVAIVALVGVAVLLFLNQPMLALVAMVPIPILLGGALWYTLTAHRRYRAQREASSAMNALLMDNLQGVRQIKSFGREAHEDLRFGQRADALRSGTLTVMKVWAWYSPAMACASALGLVLVLWVGGRLVIDGRMQVGALIEFVLYLSLFYEPVGRLHSLNQMLQSARSAGERVFDILDTPVEAQGVTAPASGATPPGRITGRVEYHGVCAQYAEGRVALDRVDLCAEPGEMIALVGPTGAGKTTLVQLLPRFYELSAGAIRIDGRDLRDYPLPFLRSQVAVVGQEPFLFNGTIRENILYGRLDATMEDVDAAARAANCHDFIHRLPEGYDTRVGERGVRLSVGEKQRITIARALLKNAPILILDEATASVDTATERRIQEALENLMRGRTSFVVAHRLSTIRHAHQILVLNHGQIVERGSHERLVAEGGLYARMVRAQAAVREIEGSEESETPENRPVHAEAAVR
jgi:ABC-type multidrug transport system fused ATPase/permease subunit